MFVGKNGVTYGYQNTLTNYKKKYNGPDQMGTLTFNLIKVERLSPEYYFVVGKWHLKRNAGDVSGHYNLMFRKINGNLGDHCRSQQLGRLCLSHVGTSFSRYAY